MVAKERAAKEESVASFAVNSSLAALSWAKFSNVSCKHALAEPGSQKVSQTGSQNVSLTFQQAMRATDLQLLGSIFLASCSE